MSVRYRKWGRSVRREAAHRISVDEGGEAIEHGGVFRTRSLEEMPDLPAPDPSSVDATAKKIESIVTKPLVVERMIISEGFVEHEVSPGNIRWREQSRRIHLSIARPPLRALIDLAEFDVDRVAPILDALRRVGPERAAPPRIRLAEHVGAALLSTLDTPKRQSAAPRDGNGVPIEERPVTLAMPPNWYRPTYRLPPRRAWFHLRIEERGEIDPDAPLAVALLAPVQKRRIRVLCVARGSVFPATVGVGPVAAACPTATWYPYGAGAFGAEIMF